MHVDQRQRADVAVERAGAGGGDHQRAVGAPRPAATARCRRRPASTRPALSRAARGVDHPPVVPAQVDGDEHVVGAQQGDRAAHRDVVAVDQRHVVAQRAEVADELHRDALRRVARQDEDPSARVGEMLDDVGQRRRRPALSSVACTLSSSSCRCATDDVAGGRLADPLGRRAELAGQVVLHRCLQRGEAVEAQLGGQAHHGRRARSCCCGQIGHRAERDQLTAARARPRRRGARRWSAWHPTCRCVAPLPRPRSVAATPARLSGCRCSDLDTLWNMCSSTRTAVPRPIARSRRSSGRDRRADRRDVPAAACRARSAFVRAAGHAAGCCRRRPRRAGRLRRPPDRSGALLLRGMPVGDLPATPSTPTTPADKDHVSEFTLLTVARRLGQPVGYGPEHGGDIVQNIVPDRRPPPTGRCRRRRRSS